VVVLMMIIPSLGIMFPSLYCEFAIVFAIMAYIVAHLYNKHSIGK